MFSAAELLANGLGKKISLLAKNGVKEGSFITALGPVSLMFDGPVLAQIEGDTVSVTKGGGSQQNGIFIRNMDNRATMGVLATGSVMISDQFSGCDFTVIRNPSGVIFGSHVHSDAASRACVNAGLPAGWTHLYTWKSAGYALNKWPGVGGIVAFVFIEGNKIKLVVAGIAGPGIIKHIDYHEHQI